MPKALTGPDFRNAILEKKRQKEHKLAEKERRKIEIAETDVKNAVEKERKRLTG